MSNLQQEQYVKMTQTPIPKLIIGLSIPTTISMLITNIYNMADTFFVSKISISASGATGIVFSYGNSAGFWIYVWAWCWQQYIKTAWSQKG